MQNKRENGVKQYIHDDKKRIYNPPVGLVTAESDQLTEKTVYEFDPHFDPQLKWTGKSEHTSFAVDTVSLHVHERIDPLTIIEQVTKKVDEPIQMSLFHYFEKPEQNPPLREAIHFYKHSQNWSNRMIAGDSLLVMNSLLQKEGMTGKVQMVYIDPPYGIKYGSNFQPFINTRDVKDGKDEDLTQEPETVKAFRDTWELGIHSYLTYLRDRFLLARELLHESGSCFVQISDENLHHVRELMDEVFGSENFVATIVFRKKKMPLGAKYLEYFCDYILFYAKNKEKLKYRQLYISKSVEGDSKWCFVELPDGDRRRMKKEEHNNHALLPPGATVYLRQLISPAGFNTSGVFPVKIGNKIIKPPPGKSWKTSQLGMDRLIKANRIELSEDGKTLNYVLKLSDFSVTPLSSLWEDTSGAHNQKYVIETSPEVIKRCMLMASDPGDLIFDPTCGGATTAFVAEQWGRRWITCDTSRVAINLGKYRLMTAFFDYYVFEHPNEGVSSGFKYRKVPHKTLGSIANNEPAKEEILYDKPLIDKTKKRITGPFTVEAVPSQRVMSLDGENLIQEADTSIVRSGETARINYWIEELQVTGIRGKSGQKIELVRIEPISGTRHLHAEGETKEEEAKRIVISFGPTYAPLEQRQVELAIEEAQKLVPKPKIIVFASFQFDSEAAKDIDELIWPGVTILKVQMNTDLLTADLKKKRSRNESFWLVGQPDIELKKSGQKYVLQVNGFDYYNPKTGEIESGDISKIAMWFLDTNYDGRSLYPRQVFFPMFGANEGWQKLAKHLKGIVDEELIENLKGNNSLFFRLGDKRRVAVKIIDDRGIESLKVIEVKE
jgi:adenine-specific DNA-methyltransferase